MKNHLKEQLGEDEHKLFKIALMETISRKSSNDSSSDNRERLVAEKKASNSQRQRSATNSFSEPGPSPAHSRQSKGTQGKSHHHPLSRPQSTRSSYYTSKSHRRTSRPRTSTTVSRPSDTQSSMAGAIYPRRQQPLYPVRTRSVSPDELITIVGRLTRPTVASRGGVDLENKDFTYIKPPRIKTLPIIPGLERRYLGLDVVSSKQLEDIVSRLTRMTSAYEAKFAPNRNVWVDQEPGAHLVRIRKARHV